MYDTIVEFLKNILVIIFFYLMKENRVIQNEIKT